MVTLAIGDDVDDVGTESEGEDGRGGELTLGDPEVW